MNVLEARRRLLGAGVYKKTVTGNPAIAQGSLARMYPGIEMQGWTEQDGTTGAQLFDVKTYPFIDAQWVNMNTGEVILNNSSYKSTSEFIPFSDYIGTTINLNHIPSGTNPGMAFYSSNTMESYISGGKGDAITVPEGTAYMRFTVDADVPDNDVMLNAGSEALPWEPYTGGAPSPSPDYPQEIVSAGKYDEAIGKYEYGVEICGKNLFNPNGEHVSGLYLGFPINNKDTVSIAIYEKNSNIDVSGIFFGFTRNGINAEDGAYWVLSNGNVMSDGKTYYEPQNGYVSIYPPNKLETFLERYDVMLNDGRAVYPAYEPYKTPQTVTLTSDRLLTKWDKLEKRDGQWGWEYGSAEIVFDGSDDENWRLYTSNNGFFIVISDMLTGNLIDGFCNSFIDYSISEYKYPSIRFGASNNVIYVVRVEDYAYHAFLLQRGSRIFSQLNLEIKDIHSF